MSAAVTGGPATSCLSIPLRANDSSGARSSSSGLKSDSLDRDIGSSAALLGPLQALSEPSCRNALACKFSGPKSFGLQFRGPKWIWLRDSPRRSSSPSVTPCRSARVFPPLLWSSTTLFDAEERLLKRSVRLIDALELI